jgi:hypothetical protein
MLKEMSAREEREARRHDEVMKMIQRQESELADLKTGLKEQSSALPERTAIATSQQAINEEVSVRLNAITDPAVRCLIEHLSSAFDTLTGEVGWVPAADKSGQPVIVVSVPGLLQLNIKRFGFREFQQSVPGYISYVKQSLTVANPDDAKEFDAILCQTPFSYTLGGGKKAKNTFYLTDTVFKNMLIIESKDFRKVMTSQPVQQKQPQITLTSGSVDWSKLKLKTSHTIPFHTSSTTTDVNKVLPQFKDLTYDEKLVMPSIGVEWWSELMQTTAYKEYFGFESGVVHHFHAGKVDSSRAVRSYADICSGL